MKYTVRSIREKCGYTVTELAEMVNTSKSHISRIEKGESQPSVDVLYKISKALNVPIDDLICRNTSFLCGDVALQTNKTEVRA